MGELSQLSEVDATQNRRGASFQIPEGGVNVIAETRSHSVSKSKEIPKSIKRRTKNASPVNWAIPSMKHIHKAVKEGGRIALSETAEFQPALNPAVPTVKSVDSVRMHRKTTRSASPSNFITTGQDGESSTHCDCKLSDDQSHGEKATSKFRIHDIISSSSNLYQQVASTSGAMCTSPDTISPFSSSRHSNFGSNLQQSRACERKSTWSKEEDRILLEAYENLDSKQKTVKSVCGRFKDATADEILDRLNTLLAAANGKSVSS